MTTRYYAGVGSRETPAEVLLRIKAMAAAFAKRGWTLRSGHAEGADTAFFRGADAVNGKMEIFTPWSGFGGAPAGDPRFFSLLRMSMEAESVAKSYHPRWSKLSPSARKMQTRNVFQVLGPDLKTHSEFVACWTPEGAGGTGQAIRIAMSYGIPVFDLAHVGQARECVEFANHYSPSRSTL